jgi:hypothetical protein
MRIPSSNRTLKGELASNLFHAVVAGLFGIVSLAAAAHIALTLA